MRSGVLVRLMHRLHRLLGSVLALLLAMWFASGAVMTFARYPTYSEHERLAHAAPLPALPDVYVPPDLGAWLSAGGLDHGASARLALIEEHPSWLFEDAQGRRLALSALRSTHSLPINRERALREAERRLGAKVRSARVLASFDQWTVGRHFRPWFPLLKVELVDPQGTQAYVSMQTGEIVQQSTASERLLAWLGPIPHWIYPAVLRNESSLWRGTVLTLASLALALSLSGIIAGLHVAWVMRRTQRAKAKASRVRDPYLRWHQRLGLLFGLLVSTWLLSGALSLSPFGWGEGPWPDQAELARAHRVEAAHRANSSRAETLSISVALAHCSRELEVRELELLGFAGTVYALCADKDAKTRLVDLRDPELIPQANLGQQTLRALAVRLTPHNQTFQITLAARPDDYYYPRHDEGQHAHYYARIDVNDREQTSFYIDPARARLLARHTQTTRLTRWLYHGLHSLDLPALYKHRVLWRSVVIAAMSIGLTLSLLGLAMSLRRARRRLRTSTTRSRASGRPRPLSSPEPHAEAGDAPV